MQNDLKSGYLRLWWLMWIPKGAKWLLQFGLFEEIFKIFSKYMQTVAKFRFISLELSEVALGRLKPKFAMFFFNFA